MQAPFQMNSLVLLITFIMQSIILTLRCHQQESHTEWDINHLPLKKNGYCDFSLALIIFHVRERHCQQLMFMRSALNLFRCHVGVYQTVYL